jgi:FtsP/CotA-like multicopper oxidase with cupredoxin domain
MDGNPVPNPMRFEVLSLAVAERVDAVVEMKLPGRLGAGLDTGKSARDRFRHCS